MVKFQKRSEDDFQTVIGHLELMIEKAQEKITSNWSHWDEIKSASTSH